MMKVFFDYVFEMVNFEFYFDFKIIKGKKLYIIFFVKIVDGVIVIFELFIVVSFNVLYVNDVF